MNYNKRRQQLIQKYVTIENMDVMDATRRAVQEVRRLRSRDAIKAQIQEKVAKPKKPIKINNTEKGDTDNGGEDTKTITKREGSGNLEGAGD